MHKIFERRGPIGAAVSVFGFSLSLLTSISTGCGSSDSNPTGPGDSNPPSTDSGNTNPPPASDAGGGGDASARIRHVFVTSSKYASNFGGTQQADDICEGAANAAGLGGSWIAWVSASTGRAVPETPIERLTLSGGPWYLVDGTTKIFNNEGNLRTKPLAPINRDEHGAVLAPTEGAWTATEMGGIASPDDCRGWSDEYQLYARVGLPGRVGGDAGDSDWTEGETDPCAQRYHFICLER